MTSTARILYVNATCAPNPLLPPLVRALDPRRYAFAVATLGTGGPLQSQLDGTGAIVHCLDAEAPRRIASAVRGLARLVKELQPDLIHSNLFWPGLEVALAGPLLRHTPVVYTRHHDDSHHLAGKRAHVAADAWTARRSQQVIAPSTAVAETLVRRERVPRDNVTVVPHGLEWERVRAAGLAQRGRWRERLGDGPLAVAIGRLDALKDYPSMLRAFAIARRSAPGLQLAIAGPAGLSARGDLASLATQAGVQLDCVHLVGYTESVHGLLAAADVFVQASRAESFGLSVLEAMGLGVPLAVTTPGGVAEIVAPWYDLLPAGDPAALAERITRVLEDSASARKMAKQAAADVVQRFTAARMAAGHAAVYDRVLTGERL